MNKILLLATLFVTGSPVLAQLPATAMYSRPGIYDKTSGVIRVTGLGTVTDLVANRCIIEIVVGAEGATLDSAKHNQYSLEQRVNGITTITRSTQSESYRTFGLVFDENGKVKSVLVQRQYDLEAPADKLEATISSLLAVPGVLIASSRFNVDQESQANAQKVARDRAISDAHKKAVEAARINNVVLDDKSETYEPLKDAFDSLPGLAGPKGTATAPVRRKVETGLLDPAPIHVTNTIIVHYHTHPVKPGP